MSRLRLYRPRHRSCATLTHRRSAGFTLLELITVITILGVLTVAVIWTLPNPSSYEARGFHDETLAMLRYAQKTAISHRRVVCVALDSRGVTLTLDSASEADGECESSVATPATVGSSGLSATANDETVDSFEFQPSGATNLSSQLVITITGADPIYVAPTTGYVYD